MMLIRLALLFCTATLSANAQPADTDFVKRWLRPYYTTEQIGKVRAFYIGSEGRFQFYTLGQPALDSALALLDVRRIASVTYSRVKKCNYVPGKGSIYILEASRMTNAKIKEGCQQATLRLSRPPAVRPALEIDGVPIDPLQAANRLAHLPAKNIWAITDSESPAPGFLFGPNGSHGLIRVWTSDPAKKSVAPNAPTPPARQYRMVVPQGPELWALSTRGTLARFTLADGAPLPAPPPNEAPVLVLTSDHNHALVLADSTGAVKRYDSAQGAWVRLCTAPGAITGLAFDSRNRCYVLTEKGVYDAATGQTFFPPDSLRNHSIRIHDRWVVNPVYHMDRNDRLWLGFGYGEWGGQLLEFDSRTQTFSTARMQGRQLGVLPVQSVFESPTRVYVTTSLMHFTISGALYELDNLEATRLLESEPQPKPRAQGQGNDLLPGEYIGPGAYNPQDSCLYFYSQNGIFRGRPGTDLSSMARWTRVLQPKLHWSNGQPFAVGSPMNLRQLLFSGDGHLIFVTEADGIGLYDGKRLRMIR